MPRKKDEMREGEDGQSNVVARVALDLVVVFFLYNSSAVRG